MENGNYAKYENMNKLFLEIMSFNSSRWFESVGVLNSKSASKLSAITQEEINFGLWSGPGRLIYAFAISFYELSSSESDVFTLFSTLNIREYSDAVARGRCVLSLRVDCSEPKYKLTTCEYETVRIILLNKEI